MLTYRYDLAADMTLVTDGPKGDLIQAYNGRIPHKQIHEEFGVLVFEVIPTPEILALPTQELLCQA